MTEAKLGAIAGGVKSCGCSQKLVDFLRDGGPGATLIWAQPPVVTSRRLRLYLWRFRRCAQVWQVWTAPLRSPRGGI